MVPIRLRVIMGKAWTVVLSFGRSTFDTVCVQLIACAICRTYQDRAPLLRPRWRIYVYTSRYLPKAPITSSRHTQSKNESNWPGLPDRHRSAVNHSTDRHRCLGLFLLYTGVVNYRPKSRPNLL